MTGIKWRRQIERTWRGGRRGGGRAGRRNCRAAWARLRRRRSGRPADLFADDDDGVDKPMTDDVMA